MSNENDFALLGLIGSMFSYSEGEKSGIKKLESYYKLTHDELRRALLEFNQYRHMAEKLKFLPEYTHMAMKLNQINHRLFPVFDRAYRLFCHSFFIDCSNNQILLLELLLKKLIGQTSTDIKLFKILQDAKNQNIISEKEYLFLSGFRHARNENVHDGNDESTEHDCLFLFQIINGILNKNQII